MLGMEKKLSDETCQKISKSNTGKSRGKNIPKSDTHKLEMAKAFIERKLKYDNFSSKFIGVKYNKRDGNWIGRIWDYGKDIHVGVFDTELQAAQMRDRYIIDHKISNKILNFPISED